MYLIKEGYIKDKSRHYYNLYLCRCGNFSTARKDKTPVCRNCSDINFNALSCYKRLYDEYYRSSWRRHLSFSLTLNDFILLVRNKCYYCSTENSNCLSLKNGRKLYYNGIDRIDNDIGYQPTNCVSCCKQCNFSKRDLSVGSFLSWAKNVVNNTKERTC